MPRFRVLRDDIAGDLLKIRGAGFHHLRRVLRLGVGDRIEVFDGEGSAFAAEIASLGRTAAEARILGSIASTRESGLELTLAVALAKGTKLDWVVEKATELGVVRVQPFASERTVPDRGSHAARLVRWRRIAGQAAAQSGRASVPEVSAISSFADVVGSPAEFDARILFWERGGRGLGAVAERPERVLVVTGPEGGFSKAEVGAAARAGFAVAGLGPRIVRAETAAVTAVALCQFLWGDLGGR